ncbi:MAG: hypothetical protein WCH46_06965 [bacterium]
MKTFFIIVFLSLVASIALAQFRPETGISEQDKPTSTIGAMSNHGENIFSSLFDPMRLSMHQTYTMSFMTGGGQSTSLGMFTNTFAYQTADNLAISADVSAVYSPFSTLGTQFQKSINGIYLSSARLDWKMGEHTFMRIEYNGLPYSSYYSPFASDRSLFSPLR